jgi:hypothetical protein
MQLHALSNEEILSSLKALVGEGNRLVAKVITYLMVVEDRRLHLEAACSSMFDYCTASSGSARTRRFRGSRRRGSCGGFRRSSRPSPRGAFTCRI